MRTSHRREEGSPVNTDWYQVPCVSATLTRISYSLSMVMDASLSTTKPSLAYNFFRLSTCERMPGLLHSWMRITSWENDMSCSNNRAATNSESFFIRVLDRYWLLIINVIEDFQD